MGCWTYILIQEVKEGTLVSGDGLLVDLHVCYQRELGRDLQAHNREREIEGERERG